MAITSHVQYNEAHASHALNRKFSQVALPGIYSGFEVAPEGGSYNVVVSTGSDSRSVAVVERDGYSLQLYDAGTETVEVPTIAATYHVVLQAQYTLGSPTTQSVEVVEDSSLLSHHVVLATVTVAGGEVEVTAGMIDTKARMWARRRRVVATKPADTSRTDAAISDDPDLVDLPVRQGRRYALSAVMSFNGGSGGLGSFPAKWTAPAGVTIDGFAISTLSASGTAVEENTQFNMNASSSGQTWLFRLLVDATGMTDLAGTLAFQWGTGDAGEAHILFAHSHAILEETDEVL